MKLEITMLSNFLHPHNRSLQQLHSDWVVPKCPELLQCRQASGHVQMPTISNLGLKINFKFHLFCSCLLGFKHFDLPYVLLLKFIKIYSNNHCPQTAGLSWFVPCCRNRHPPNPTEFLSISLSPSVLLLLALCTSALLLSHLWELAPCHQHDSTSGEAIHFSKTWSWHKPERRQKQTGQRGWALCWELTAAYCSP